MMRWLSSCRQVRQIVPDKLRPVVGLHCSAITAVTALISLFSRSKLASPKHMRRLQENAVVSI